MNLLTLLVVHGLNAPAKSANLKTQVHPIDFALLCFSFEIVPLLSADFD